MISDMERLSIAIIFVLVMINHVTGQVAFDRYFSPKTLRMDYSQAGNSEFSKIYLEELKKEPYWGGARTNLIDTFRYGEYMLEVYDSLENTLIYSRGYSNLFREWQKTMDAEIFIRDFYEIVTMPFPKNTVQIKLKRRNRLQQFENIYKLYVNPKNANIVEGNEYKFEVEKIHDSGLAETNVDIVIIPEGYTEEEMQKFKMDAERFMGYFFSWQPFNSYKDKFNFYEVLAPSMESGTDIPGENIWKNTVLNSNFYTFGSARYLTTRDIRTLRDIAALVPYDQIYVLVNSEKYGGGAIYNFFNFCTSDHQFSEFVFMHEFGHGFASLADEYYDSAVAYSDYYNIQFEPYEPNITTLVDFDSKWKDMLEPGMPIPTPATEEFINKIGVFEGGGYSARGIYRPTFESSMKTKINNRLGPVNSRAIIQMIKFYCD